MNLLIIQARMGSTRLPGKVLKHINHQSILENLVERVTPSKLIDAIVIATTTNAEDDAIEQLCMAKSWNYFRGSDWDVLSRFYLATKQFSNVENVIRVTSDCPLHSHKVVDFVVEEYLKAGTDYFSNSNNEPDFLEDGFDTEVFTFKALETAFNEASKLSEREHVTPYIKFSGKFTCAWKKSNPNYTFKMSVDSPDDFEAVQTIFEELKNTPDFGIDEVTNLLISKPEIIEKNKNSVANSGYVKSIENDREVK
jgi:spore coat polysaccharide biosynthesis protein SpsF